MITRLRVLLIAISFLALNSFSLAQESHVRIVRISYIEGSIRVNNQNVTTNTPLIEGNEVSSGVDSFAEIEFEDGTTARVGPNTRLIFSQLARLSSGDSLTRIDLEVGEVELATNGRMQGEFAIGAASKVVDVPRGSRIRVLSTKDDPLELAVRAGEAKVHDPESGQDVAVEKHETFMLAADDPQQYDLEKGVEADELDRFSDLRDQYLSNNYVSSPNSSTAGLSTSGFVDPCQPYYWYPGVPVNCFSSPFFFPFLSFGYSPYGYGSNGYYGYPYVPGYYYGPHRRPPIIHPPTPARAAAIMNSVAAKGGETGTRHIRSFNDENFTRSFPVQEEHEGKIVGNQNTENHNSGGHEFFVRTRQGQPEHSTDSRQSSSRGLNSSSMHSSSRQSASGGSNGSSMHSSGAGAHSSGGSYSGSSSHSSGFSSGGGGSFHSSSSSSSSSSAGSSGRH